MSVATTCSSSNGGEQGKSWEGRVVETSAYTRAALHPGKAALAALGVGMGLLAGLGRCAAPAGWKKSRSEPPTSF